MEIIKIIISAYLVLALVNGLFVSLTSKTFRKVGLLKQMLVLITSPILIAREFTTRRGK